MDINTIIERDDREREEEGLDLSFDAAAGGVDTLNLFMNQLGNYKLLTAAEEVELAKKIERGDSAAKERMINSNLRLVVHVARRYMGQGVALGDLIQEGVIGLNRAVEKFDWRKGFKFSTYATWWIRQACQRAVANQSKTIRIPVHVDERRRKLSRERQKFEAAHGREPTVEELAKAAGLELLHTQEALDAVEANVSLNRPIGDDGDGELADLLADFESVDPMEEADTNLRDHGVRQALEVLPERERRVIELRFGLCGTQPCTLEEVGQAFGVTRERIRQIENNTLKKLEGLPEAQALRDCV
jgi:RNA polymerase primary sigma factor